MRKNLIILFLLICNFCIGQINSDILSFFSNKDTVDWNKYELKIADRNKLDFALKLKPHFKELFEPSWGGVPMQINRFVSCLHFMNLNNDTNPDVIYYGYSGSEANSTVILISKGVGFKKIFSDYGHLEKLEFDSLGNFHSFTIMYNGCCAEYIENQTRYNVDDLLKVTKDFRRSIVDRTEEPKNRFDIPIRFKTLNDSYTLRSTAKIDNNPGSINGDSRKGNITAIYPKDSEGLAWAEKKDDTGRIWWFVEMDPYSNLKDNIVYGLDGKSSRIVGWISSRFVEIVKE